MANLDPRGRIHVEYHLTFLHTKYTSLRPCGFRRFLNVFPHYKRMADDAPVAWPIWTPGSPLAGIIKGSLNIASHKI